jgi:spermidine/putrescine transport system substrate-binding protein
MAPRSRGLTRRQFIKSAAYFSAGATLSSCGWKLADVRPPVNTGSKDQLFIFSWTQYIDKELVSNFTQETGIKVSYNTFSSNEEMLAQYKAGKKGTYSIIYPSDYMVAKMAAEDLLQELDHNRLPGLDALWSKFRNSTHDPGNRYSVPLSWGTTGILYNANKLAPPPDDWDYLWRQAGSLSRRMTLLDDNREVFGACLRSLGFSYNSTNPDEINQAFNKLSRLKPSVAQFTTDAWRDRLMAGDLDLAMVFSADATSLMQENSKLRYVIPKSGTSVWSDTMVIPRSAPNPDAAYAWMTYMLRPQVAATLTQRLLFATPNRQAFNKLPNDLQQNTALYPPETLLEKSESITPVSDEIAELYEKYWTTLTSS